MAKVKILVNGVATEVDETSPGLFGSLGYSYANTAPATTPVIQTTPSATPAPTASVTSVATNPTVLTQSQQDQYFASQQNMAKPLSPLDWLAQQQKPITSGTLQQATTTPPPATPQPTANQTNETYFNSLTASLEASRKALEDAYKKQQESYAKQTSEMQAKMDTAIAGQKGVLDSVERISTPFRADLETTERDRLKIEENYFENQKLVNELEMLLTEGNELIKSQKGMTGLSAIRDPRVNQTISEVSARAGVLESVMAARNNQISVAENLIDRSVNAINADRQDQLNYYSNLYNFYGTARDESGNALITLKADEKKFINAQIALLENDMAQAQTNAEYIKQMMIDPDKARVLAESGVTLNDTPEQVQKKFAEYGYKQEVTDTSNQLTTKGYAYLTPEQAAVLPSGSFITTTDSRGNVKHWKVPEGEMQQLESGQLAIDLAKQKIATEIKQRALLGEPTSADIEAEQKAVNTANGQIETLQQKIDLVDAIQDSGGITARVGTTRFSREGFGIPFTGGKLLGVSADTLFSEVTGEGQQFAGGVHRLVSQEFLDALINAKKQGATFGALTDREGDALRMAATEISDWEIKDKDGKGMGYWNIDEATFNEKLNTIKESAKKAILRSKGTLLTTEEQMFINNLTTNSVPAGDYFN